VVPHAQSTQISVSQGSASSASDLSVKLADAKTTIDLLTIGGYGLSITGMLILLSKLTITPGFNFFGANPTYGFMVIPFLVGVGMLFYNFRSRLAQLVTLCSFGAIVFMVLCSTRIVFPTMSMLDVLFMGLPLCAGAAMLVKAQVKRRELPAAPKSAVSKES
jgi:hypothetical protein